MSELRRIAFPFVGDTLGGSHLSALALIRQLPGQGFAPVIVLHQKGPLAAHLDGLGQIYTVLENVPVAGREASLLGQARKLFDSFLPLRAWLKRNAIDLIHANDARTIATWALPARTLGLGFVAHQRTIAYPSRILAMGWRLANRIVAISHYTRQSLPAAFQAKTEVIYNPVEQSDGPPIGASIAERRAMVWQKAGVIDGTPVVGAFGNLSAVKQPRLFAQALAKVAQTQPVVGVWFGSGEDQWQAEMRQVAGHATLLFMPFVSPVEPWMAACDAVAATSARDGFGRTIVEAMSVGVPVVATAAGGHVEIARDGHDALLVPPADGTAMAAALLRVLTESTLREALIHNGMETARRFLPADHARQLASIYRRILPLDRLLVITDLGSGGAQRVAVDLAGKWAQAGYATGLVTLSGIEPDRLPLKACIERGALDLTGSSVGMIDAVIQSFARMSALRRYIRHRRPGTVVSFVGATNILTILATVGLSVRTVISERNDPARQHLGFPWQQLRQLFYRYADVVTANSQSAIEALAAYVPRQRLRLANNQLSDAVLSAAEPEQQTEREQILLAVGRLHRQKGYDLLLPAFAKSQAAATGWRLVVLGEGGLQSELMAQTQALDLTGQVDWRGFEADPTIWYRRAGIFVMPSRYEGTPNALLEAGAFGMAVIVSDSCGGALDLVEDGKTGLVVPTGDISALAAAMDRLTRSAGERERLGSALRRRVLDRHHPVAVMAGWESALAS